MKLKNNSLNIVIACWEESGHYSCTSEEISVNRKSPGMHMQRALAHEKKHGLLQW